MKWLLRETVGGFGSVNQDEKSKTCHVFLFSAGFTNYMRSPAGDVFNPDHYSVNQDMKQPLCNYFIASSHNTYLMGDQLMSQSRVDMYAWVLQAGCRCVEGQLTVNTPSADHFLIFIWPWTRSVNECDLKPQLTVGTAQTENRWFTTDTRSPPRYCSETWLRPSTSMPSSRMSTYVHSFTCTSRHTWTHKCLSLIASVFVTAVCHQVINQVVSE